MSNLDLILLEGDNEGLMTAAMDLIDSIASDSATGSSDDNSSAITDLSRGLAETAPRKPRRKRVAKPGYSTEQGRRKKAEVLALRSQVQGLEQWIQHLKRHKVAGVAPSERRAASPAPADQSRQAMEEFQKRQKSEVANRKLKAVMATQTELGKAILEIIRQNAALKDKELVFGLPRHLPGAYDNSAVIGRLKIEAFTLFHDMDVVVPMPPETIYSSEMVPKVDPSRGKMFECTTVCTVQCSMESASDLLWFEYTYPRKYENKTYRFFDTVGPNAVKKSFDLLMNSKRGAISMSGLMFANRFEDHDRVTMVRDYVAFLLTAGLHMRCHHWTIVTASEVPGECHIQFYFQIYMEKNSSEFSANPDDVEYVQEVELAAWCAKMHVYSHQLHERLERLQLNLPQL